MVKDLLKISPNKEQTKAIKYQKGPLLIIAGAGTGKTTVITERIKYLIHSNISKPSEILALTFTEKAAKEMEERVDISLPFGYTQMWISTFHSFCDRILRQEVLEIGINPKYKLFTQSETVQYIRDNLFKFNLDYFRPLGNPTKFVEGIQQHFSRLQDEDISVKEYLEFARKKHKSSNKESEIDSQKINELANAYKTYDNLKTKDSFMDFGDLITKTLLLFRKRPNILANYRKQFTFILVDEFQDTNVAQYELLKLLAPPSHKANLTVVGDDSQSIYKFRGAAVSNILNFIDDYKDTKTVVLTKNYRSTQTILDTAYKLIQHNNPDTLEVKMGIDKNLISIKNPKGGEKIKFIHQDRVENEADSVAIEINQIIKKNKIDFKDVAILVRANNHSEPFSRALSRHGIPYQFLGPGRLFKQPEIIDLISYLRVLYNFEDSVSFYRLLSIRHFNIDSKDLSKIGNFAKRFNLSIFEACEKIEKIQIKRSTKEKIEKISKIIKKHLRLLNKETAGQILFYFLDETGLLAKLLDPKSDDAQKKAANISKFFDKLKTYEVDHQDASIFAVVDWTDINAVNILTVHSAKGLEFPVVFLVNLVNHRFPTIERRDKIPIPEELIKEILPEGDSHLQEERRLFYVGMTRAKETLILTAANYYGEGKRERKLSPFIFESLGDNAISAEKIMYKQTNLFSYKARKKARATDTSGIGKKPFHIDYLSYSQIETFRICPLHYKLKYILNIPTFPSAAQSFGISIHSALKDFYAQLIKNIRATKKLTKKQAEKNILEHYKQNWVNEGYSHKSHKDKMYKKGQIYLKEYIKNEFSLKTIPNLVESQFTLPLYSSKTKKELKIGGRIDRIDTLSNNKIEIIDYKTGANVPTQKQVDHNLQLSFYALAATRIKESPFNKKPENVILTLYYLSNNQKISTTRTLKELEEAVRNIINLKTEIEKSEFKCSKNYLCRNCEYKLLCNSEE
jgi:DNA helicase-2/ATP-dependent DNA helicase PcrA